MIKIGNILPAVSKLGQGRTSRTLLDLVFTNGCLWMEHASLLVSPVATSVDVPVPLLGFEFDAPDDFTLLSYSYAKYPYLNKAAVTNSFIKETCPISIVAYRPITAKNPVGLNFVLNYAGVKYYIEKYADRGGTWSLVTGWGLINNLVLTKLEAIRVEGSDLGGVGFRFSFERINFDDTSSISKSVSSLAQKLGGV